MSYRKFTDVNGNTWEVRDRSRSEWQFEPLPGNPEARRTVQPPGYETDPFELSDRELQRLLGSTKGPSRPAKKSPFLD